MIYDYKLFSKNYFYFTILLNFKNDAILREIKNYGIKILCDNFI